MRPAKTGRHVCRPYNTDGGAGTTSQMRVRLFYGTLFPESSVSELTFDVVLDEAGNWCASAKTAHGSLFTDAKTMDGLLGMIADLLALYAEDAGETVQSITLRLPAVA